MSMNASNLILGKETNYAEEYSGALLTRIERKLGRSMIKHLQSFSGVDIWHLYELTYLDTRGLPHVCMGIMKIPSSSRYIVESKSLKLYTMSFTQTKFESISALENLFEKDLCNLLECDASVQLFELANKSFGIETLNGDCLEDLDICKDMLIQNYSYDPKLLSLDSSRRDVSETVYTNLFRSLCPVTSQPDYASVSVSYKGKAIDRRKLLEYFISLRHHQGFHEQCVELIYSDILYYLRPEQLTVRAYFTRRGGIDINPVRSNTFEFAPSLRTIRQ